jgi:eukaryotic-like serine/threonine-protein kinase
VTPGDSIGHYTIVEPLGKGGMGEVFVAEDTRLHRRVALKVLPRLFAADAAHRERFEREARAVAALNHPNIVTLHSVEEHDGELFLTMELVEGKPLSEIIHRGGLPVDRLLRIGAEVADAIAAAQHQGITHRDLKPANVMITSSGRAKVLDFGLAKLKDAEIAAAGDDLTRMSPRDDLTGEGKIVGTVAYMSPEQAEGKSVDSRSDIFSLGVVLHEMATGDKPFKGDTNVSIISSIIKDTPPPVTDSNPALPADLARIVRRCLAKDPERRYQTAADLRNELEELKQDTASGTIAMPRAAATRRRMPTAAIVAGVAAIAAAVAAGIVMSHYAAAPVTPGAMFTIDRLSRLTANGTARLAAVSPDGRYVVHVKGEPGGVGLWTRQTATTSDVRIVAPADVRFDGLAFTPDANYIYYNVYTGVGGIATLFRVPVLGGPPAKILDDIDSPVTFSPDQRQLAFLRGAITRGVTELITADAAGGGERVVAVAGPSDKFQSEGLTWSPDGATILVSATSTRPGIPTIVYAVDVKSGTAKPLGEAWAFVRDLAWMPDGRSYLATAIDFSGQPNPQIWRVTYPGGERTRVTNDLNAYLGLSLSSDGKSLVTVQTEVTAAVYVAEGAAREPRKISGGPARADGSNGLAWLPDGRLIYSSTATGLAQLWIADADGGNARQLTSMQPPAGAPCSTPDGKWIWFTSYAKEGSALFRIAPDGSGLQQMTNDGDARGAIVAPDGKTVYYTAQRTGTPHVMRMPIEGGTAQSVSPAFFIANDISPDGTRLVGRGWSETRRQPVIETMSVADGDVSEVQGVVAPTYFLPDGGFAVAQRIQGKSVITSRPAKEKAFRPVTPPNAESVMGSAVSRDGRIAFSRGEQISDVVLIKAK